MIVALIKGPSSLGPAIPPKHEDAPSPRPGPGPCGSRFSAACLTHLHRAKRYYAQGQDLPAPCRRAGAVAHWQRALDEAREACRRSPSARPSPSRAWPKRTSDDGAKPSLLPQAFSLGFREGEALGLRFALAGLAVSFEDMGLEAPSSASTPTSVDTSDSSPRS